MSIGEPINQTTTKLYSLELVGGSYGLGKRFAWAVVCGRTVSPFPHTHSTKNPLLFTRAGLEETPFLHFDGFSCRDDCFLSSRTGFGMVPHAENWESYLTFTIWLWVNFIFGDFVVCVFLPHVDIRS